MFQVELRVHGSLTLCIRVHLMPAWPARYAASLQSITNKLADTTKIKPPKFEPRAHITQITEV